MERIVALHRFSAGTWKIQSMGKDLFVQARIFLIQHIEVNLKMTPQRSSNCMQVRY